VTDAPEHDAPANDPRQDSTRRRNRMLFLGIFGAFALAILFLFRGVLFPFLLALIVAYVLEPVCMRLERVRIRGREVPRWAAVLSVYTALVSFMVLLITFGVPRMVVELQRLAHEAPAAITTAKEEWIPRVDRALRSAIQGIHEEEASGVPEIDAITGAEVPAVPAQGMRIQPIGPEGRDGYEVLLPQKGLIIDKEGDRIVILPPKDEEPGTRDLAATVSESLYSLTENTGANAAALLKTAQDIIRAVVKGVFTFSIMLMLSAYILVSRDRILGFFRSLVLPVHRAQFDSLIARMDRGLAGVVRGQLLIALVNGILSGIGFYLFDLRYWPILTLIAAVFSIIPIFGAILSSIPAVIIGLQQDFMTGVLVLGWILLIHQIEANLLNPKIMGDSAKVHPVLVVFALLAGEHLFGVAGALLAVPALSVTQSLFLHFRERIIDAEAGEAAA
jgi:predicted PurR-regulated permease PerM